jgi:hypothetical protein
MSRNARKGVCCISNNNTNNGAYMYCEKINVDVIGNIYKNNSDDKPKKGIVSNFNFKDGLHLKDLARFLDESRDTLQHSICGEVTVNIIIDTTKE